MKRIITWLIATTLVLGCICGCGGPRRTADDGKLDIVVTIFPVYDWVRNIVGDAPNVNLTLLVDNGTDMHSFQPSADDIITISNADVFIYVGGESDKWADDAVRDAVRNVNEDIVVFNLMEIMGDMVKEEELAEGMQEGHDHRHDEDDEDHDHEEGHDDHDEDHDHEEETEYDEHIWLSLRNAEYVTELISKMLQQKDSANATVYLANTEAYIAELDSLDARYSEMISECPKDTILVGDRFPFRYLVDDYRIKYYAAFSGCSAESEASFETITFLSGKVDELSLETVLIIEGSDGRIAETIVSNTKDKDQQILTLDSMQSVTRSMIDGGYTYLSAMENNLSVLKEALN
jgi:zinc transport system substrate-binding protein